MIRCLFPNAFLVILPSLHYLGVSLHPFANEQQAVDLHSSVFRKQGTRKYSVLTEILFLKGKLYVGNNSEGLRRGLKSMNGQPEG